MLTHEHNIDDTGKPGVPSCERIQTSQAAVENPTQPLAKALAEVERKRDAAIAAEGEVERLISLQSEWSVLCSSLLRERKSLERLNYLSTASTGIREQTEAFLVQQLGYDSFGDAQAHGLVERIANIDAAAPVWRALIARQQKVVEAARSAALKFASEHKGCGVSIEGI